MPEPDVPASPQEVYELMGVDYPGESDKDYSLEKKIEYNQRQLDKL